MSDLSRRLIQIASDLTAELESENKAVLGISATDLAEFAALMQQAAHELDRQHDINRRHLNENPLRLDNVTLGFVASLLLWRDFLARKREVGATTAVETLRQDLDAIKTRIIDKRVLVMMRLTPGLDRQALEEHITLVCNEVMDEIENIIQDFV